MLQVRKIMKIVKKRKKVWQILLPDLLLYLLVFIVAGYAIITCAGFLPGRIDYASDAVDFLVFAFHIFTLSGRLSNR
jgi:hypothetical protein